MDKLYILNKDNVVLRSYEGLIAGEDENLAEGEQAFFGELPKFAIVPTPSYNYKKERSLAYLTETNFTEEYVDGLVKLQSKDPEIQAEGKAQIDNYCAKCLAIKERFPKE